MGGPFPRVGVDVLTLHVPLTNSDNRYAVLFMDYLTKWPEVIPVPDHKAETIARLLVKHVFCKHGVPTELLSDREADFMSNVMKKVCKLAGIKKLNTTNYHPQTDGMIDRFNRTLTCRYNREVRDSTRGCTSGTSS